MTRHVFRIGVIASLITTATLGNFGILAGGDLPPLPVTPKKPVIDTYHGVKVTDPYRWLDEADGADVKKWVAAQNRHSRAALDRFPEMSALRKRVAELVADGSPDHFALQFRGGKLFALKSQPPKDQPFLVVMDSPDEHESARVVVDPNSINAKGTTAIDFFVPSRDGKLVAVSLSEGGTEEGTGYVFEVATGKKLADVIPRIQVMGGGSLAWNADASGFYYTRNPRGNEKPKDEMNFYQRVYFHKLGTPTEKDAYAIGKDFPKIAEVMLDASPDGTHILASMQNGDGGEFAHWLLGPSGDWTQVTTYSDRISTACFGSDNGLYLHSNHNAPRGKIIRVPLQTPTLAKAKTVVPESESAIDAMMWGGGGFFPTFSAARDLVVLDIVGGPSQIRVLDRDGKLRIKAPLKAFASVSQIVPAPDGTILYRSDSFLEPPAWYRFDPDTKKTTRTALFRKAHANFDDCVVEQKFATSKDGTKIPLHILRLKTSKLDGNNPTLLYGYGGYGISMKPHFQAPLRIWLEQGGIYAMANIRGGSEYGEDWRRNAQLTKRQNAYDDFAACANFLIDEKYTNPQKLAIRGGSNGGLLMGVQLTQHPELYRAVVSHVGIYDMLRSELHPNGAFNVTEFGTVKDPHHFKALHAYSPYHNVKDGTAYPAVFLLTGANDSRVDPANSLKMAARLQAATSSKHPILLQVGGSGHGLDASLSDRVLEQADVYAFLFQQLGVKYRATQEPAKSVRVLIQTDMGDIEVDLNADRAPNTVANFLRYVDEGFYKGGRFHRTVKPDNQPDNKIKIEVIQAGINPDKVKSEFPPIKLERSRDTKLAHKDGTISMARDGPDAATSDFFICIGDQPQLDFGGKRNLDGHGFAAFGQVVKGMDVVRKIQAAPAEAQTLTPPVKILKIVRK